MTLGKVDLNPMKLKFYSFIFVFSFLAAQSPARPPTAEEWQQFREAATNYAKTNLDLKDQSPITPVGVELTATNGNITNFTLSPEQIEKLMNSVVKTNAENVRYVPPKTEDL